jgi:hypothetical protein
MIHSKSNYFVLILIFLSLLSCEKDENEIPAAKLQLSSALVGAFPLNLSEASKNTNAPADAPIFISFSAALDQANAQSEITVKSKNGNENIPLTFAFQDSDKTVVATPVSSLTPNKTYLISVSEKLQGSKRETFAGATIEFSTIPGVLEIESLSISGTSALNSVRIVNVPTEMASIDINFSKPVAPGTISSANIVVANATGDIPITLTLSGDKKKLTITFNQKLKDFDKFDLRISGDVKGENQEVFTFFTRSFYSAFDPTPDFPLISDDELLTKVQQQTFKYFYDFAHPASGMARERNSSGSTVTSGGSGFGIMALIVGVERGFITRQQALDRMDRILDFLETADRFHGVWPHWLNGDTGKVIPFSTKDNGGDLVETSFLVQGLLTFRQYLDAGSVAEQNLIARINTLWQAVEWDWYRKNNENVLYWHWSPNYNWEMNFAMYGYFEEQITYFLAAASPTHSVPKIVYSNGYGKNGTIVKNTTHYGIKLPLESPAPLFWVHYSYLGLDPHFTDDYANYWEQNVNASLINQAYCVANPKKFVGYSDECWGLTSSDNQNGYNAHSPGNDLGVISPTAALSSFPYTPDQSMKALKFFYYKIGDRLWGEYGFYDAFNLTEGWTANSYLAIDQGPIIVMIENYRTGKLWDLFMSAPEVQNGVSTLSFTY